MHVDLKQSESADYSLNTHIMACFPVFVNRFASKIQPNLSRKQAGHHQVSKFAESNFAEQEYAQRSFPYHGQSAHGAFQAGTAAYQRTAAICKCLRTLIDLRMAGKAQNILRMIIAICT